MNEKIIRVLFSVLVVSRCVLAHSQESNDIWQGPAQFRLSVLERKLTLSRAASEDAEFVKVSNVPMNLEDLRLRQLKLTTWSKHGLVGAASAQSVKDGSVKYFVILIPNSLSGTAEVHEVYSSIDDLKIIAMDGQVKSASVLLVLSKVVPNDLDGAVDFGNAVVIFNGCPHNWSQDATRVSAFGKEGKAKGAE